jgi:hypothetical protein
MKLNIKQINNNIKNIIDKNDILFDEFIKEIKYELGIIKQIDNFQNFKFENMNHFKSLNDNKGAIWCLKTLEDGRLAAGDNNSNLIIYNKETFEPIIKQNNLGVLWNFTQLKNKNIACSFYSDYTLKIIKINDNNEYEDIQIIKNAHNSDITKIIELKNENIITFSYDYSFKIWKLNNNKYEKINEFKDTNYLCDGIEIKDNEIILYAVNTNPKSLVFYNLKKNEKIKTLNNLNLCIDYAGERIVKINNDEVAVAGDNKVYLIDIKDMNNYQIINEINSDYYNFSI